MASSLEIHVEFSFKGENHACSAIVDLDELLSRHGNLPSFYVIIAGNNKIDTYSYLYEVMEQAEIVCGSAKGLAAQFLKNGHFDGEGFSAKWRENRILDLLGPVALRELDADLGTNPGLKAAMLEAYRLGLESGR